MDNIWQGEFGDQYTIRSRDFDLEFRSWLWGFLIPCSCGSVLEVGANVGNNLRAISERRDIELYATEPNELARSHLKEFLPHEHIRSDFAHELGFPDNSMDCVLTCGVLIHVSPAKLVQSIREIYRVSRRFIIAAEYFAPSEEMIPYRGTKDTLWRRDYGSIYMDAFPDLQTVCEPLFLWRRSTGMDNLMIWVFEKGLKKH